MKPSGVILAIDQGTTGSTVLVMNHAMEILGRATTEFRQIYPQPGYVEHDARDIWDSVRTSVIGALQQANTPATEVVAIGITNQRETTTVWERATSRPIHHAIVWQCRRTAPVCEALRAKELDRVIQAKTGLVVDPYFSGTKLAWILDHVDGARAAAGRGELAFGTIDTYLVWQLTGGRTHVTEVSNASRTQLVALETAEWDDELLNILNVPREVLPEIRSSSEVYGETSGLDFLPNGIPISGMAGDQQAALFGQACFDVGQTKCTYGTGAFVLMNTGHVPPVSANGLLSTIAWRLGDGATVYALEGSVFIAGAAVQWLRDGLEMLESAREIEQLAKSVPDSGGVVMVPAFAGLGTPYWNADARGAIFGLTRGSNRGHLARATLEGIAHQVTDVLDAMANDAGEAIRDLRVDGGAAANDLLLQIQADFTGLEVTRPTHLETTAMGAAFLAGLGVGFWKSPEALQAQWRAAATFRPAVAADRCAGARKAWQEAVNRLL